LAIVPRTIAAALRREYAAEYEFVRIEAVDLIRSLCPAQQNLAASVAASYLAETVDTFAQSGDPAELLYRLLDRTTEALLEGSMPLRVVAYAEVWTLRLAGVLPSLRNCNSCGEALGRPLRFDSQAHGFVCPKCAAENVQVIAQVMANDVAEVLDAIMRLPAGEFAARDVSAEVLIEVRSLAAFFRRNFLGHELKSFEMLAGLVT
jgi:DNA repair protein RecO (recombination protein O)